MSEYERITWRGKTFNRRTVAMLQETERRLGKPFTIYQGSYRPQTPYSGTSHMGGGSVDCYLSGTTLDENMRAVRVMRRVGFAAWLRTPAQGNWIHHIHAQAVGDKQASDSAKWQVSQYSAAGGPFDGLRSGRPDWMTYRPNPIPVFNYQAWLKKQNLRTRLTKLTMRLRELGKRRARLTKVFNQL